MPFFPSKWRNPAQKEELKEKRVGEMEGIKEKGKAGSALLLCFLRIAWRRSRGDCRLSRSI